MLPIGPTLLDIVDNSLRIVSQDCASFKILNCMYLRRRKREGKKRNPVTSGDVREKSSYIRGEAEGKKSPMLELMTSSFPENLFLESSDFPYFSAFLSL